MWLKALFNIKYLLGKQYIFGNRSFTKKPIQIHKKEHLKYTVEKNVGDKVNPYDKNGILKGLFKSYGEHPSYFKELVDNGDGTVSFILHNLTHAIEPQIKRMWDEEKMKTESVELKVVKIEGNSYTLEKGIRVTLTKEDFQLGLDHYKVFYIDIAQKEHKFLIKKLSEISEDFEVYEGGTTKLYKKRDWNELD